MSLDLVAILTQHAHVYRDECPCDDCAETRAILDAHADDADVFDMLSDATRDALDADAAQSTRDDGALYHGRLPSGDLDGAVAELADFCGLTPAEWEREARAEQGR